jgi:hypothetical protein|tara:strand:+ start:240 stop:383 length:144 start_codon:yes stop_codon:yes gene_type:complete
MPTPFIFGPASQDTVLAFPMIFGYFLSNKMGLRRGEGGSLLVKENER